MFEFLHTFQPQPVLLQVGLIKIYWYGLLVVGGITLSLLVTLYLARRNNIKADQVYDLAFYLLIFGLLGARLYAVLLNLSYYIERPLEIFAVWQGGLAIHGAIFVGLLTLYFYCKKNEPIPAASSGVSGWVPYAKWRLRRFVSQRPSSPQQAAGYSAIHNKQNFWQWADILAVVLPLGQALGRFGNYFNQELFGLPTNLPWGIPINIYNRPAQYINNEYFHPTFLYESVLNLLNFLFLFWLYYRFRHSELVSESNKTKTLNQVQGDKTGVITFIYLINYSIIRILMEYLRTDPTPEIFGLRLPVLVSTILIIVSLGLIIFRHKPRFIS